MDNLIRSIEFVADNSIVDDIINGMKKTIRSARPLSDIQKSLVRRICILIAAQWILVFFVVLGIHHFLPRKEYVFTKTTWADLLACFAFMFLCLTLIMFVPTMQAWASAVRLVAFFTLGILFSLILGIQYNRVAADSKDKTKTRKRFIISWGATLGIFVIVLLSLPYLLPYTRVLIPFGAVLTISLLVILVLFLVVPATRKSMEMFLAAFLIVFLIFIFTDTTTVVAMCKKENTRWCDPVIGATSIYLDMINLLQKMFLLMSISNK